VKIRHVGAGLPRTRSGAGIRFSLIDIFTTVQKTWIPVSAGMTEKKSS